VASASGDGEVKIWNFLDLKEVIKLTVSPTTTIPVLSIVELDFDRILVTCNNSFKIYKLNFSDRKNSEEKFKNDAHSDLIFHLLLLKNRLLLSASADQTIKVWNSTNLTDELKTLKHHTEAVKCLVELPHDRIASGSEDRTIKIWDLSSLENAYVLKTLEGHNYWIRCLAYLESLDYLASGSWDSSIYIWDLQDFTLKKTIIASDTVYSLGILKNGDLVSGSANGYIQIWNKMNLNEVKSVYRDAAAVWCFALLPQGNLAIGLANGKVDILKFIY
jgi:WD40 repeat protein